MALLSQIPSCVYRKLKPGRNDGEPAEGLKPALRLERQGQHGQNKTDKRDHRVNLPDSSLNQPGEGFRYTLVQRGSTDTAPLAIRVGRMQTVQRKNADRGEMMTVPHPGEAAHTKGLPIVATLGALGVVYGDIGTSPLYALKEAAKAARSPMRRSSEWCR
jgi:K+ potassium transporter